MRFTFLLNVVVAATPGWNIVGETVAAPLSTSQISNGPAIAPPRLEPEPERWYEGRVDPCSALNELEGAPGKKVPITGRTFYVKITNLRDCLSQLKINNYRALWTLHNLHFGITETYSFTDIATDSKMGDHKSECKHQVHDVKVDLRRTIRQKIVAYDTDFAGQTQLEVQTGLNAYIPAFKFHQDLLQLFNQLHDAHTIYAPPLEMFRVFSPISFGSKMMDAAGKQVQVVTLRMSSPYQRNLQKVHVRLYGRMGGPAGFGVLGSGFPISARHDGEVVTKINGEDALTFLQKLTSDTGPLGAKFQQQEQRLNAFVFSVDVMVFPLITALMPAFNTLTIEMAETKGDRTVNLIGQYSDLTVSDAHPAARGFNLFSTRDLSMYMHGNPAFDAFMRHNPTNPAKTETLHAHFRHQSSGYGLLDHDLTSEDWMRINRKYRSFIDPLANAQRDALAVVAATVLNSPPEDERLLKDEHGSDDEEHMGNEQRFGILKRQLLKKVHDQVLQRRALANTFSDDTSPDSPPRGVSRQFGTLGMPQKANSPSLSSRVRESARRSAAAVANNELMASPSSSSNGEDTDVLRPLEYTTVVEVGRGSVTEQEIRHFARRAAAAASHNELMASPNASFNGHDPESAPVLKYDTVVFPGHSRRIDDFVTERDLRRTPDASFNDDVEAYGKPRFAAAMHELLSDHTSRVDEVLITDEVDPWHRGPLGAGGRDVEMSDLSGEGNYFTPIGSLAYRIVGDTVIVRIATFMTSVEGAMFPEFVDIQKIARGKNITRILFDVSQNDGGSVASAYYMLWYMMQDSSRICAPVRKRITENWKRWIDSFGIGLEGLVDKYLVNRPNLIGELDAIFEEVVQLTELLFEGLGLTAEVLGANIDQKQLLLTYINGKKLEIQQTVNSADKERKIISFFKNREFLHGLPKDNGLVPSTGFYPFDGKEMSVPLRHGAVWADELEPYKNTEERSWGERPAKYSQATEYKFCPDTITKMANRFNAEYRFNYWTEVAFVSDGTCGSACALFTQGLQTNGDAVAFSYGGLADTPIDVSSFAGGNVEEYDDFWPKLAYAAKLGRLISRGEAPWSVAHENSWAAFPIAFPSRAKAKFNWNMLFSPAMGSLALPRQFYIIPARKHFNVWPTNDAQREPIFEGIVDIRQWGTIAIQFEESGVCPLEMGPLFQTERTRRFH